MDASVCVIFLNVLCVQPCNPSVPVPNRDLSPACASSYLVNAQPIHPAPAKIPNSPSLPAQTQRKKQESIEMNGWASASWLELNGNVKLATDPLCLRVAGPVSLESTNRMMPSQWRSTPPRLPFWVTPLCLAERGREARLKKKKRERVDDTRRGIMCRICSESAGYNKVVRA